MVVKVGDEVPSVTLLKDVPDGKVNLAEHTKGKKVVIFGVPGPFTPGCTKTHAPSYIADYDKYKAAGVDEIICVSVSDPFCCASWAEALKFEDKITMLADTMLQLTKAWGIELDAPEVLGNTRCRRFSAVLKDNKVVALNLEAGGEMTCSMSNPTLDQAKAA